METVLTNRYQSLLSSIDFFSQNLNLHQIVEYGFKIYNSFEAPISSAIYTLNDSKEKYCVAFSHGYDFNLPDVVRTDQHAMFAVRNGFLLTDYDTQCRYYEVSFIRETRLSKIMPLIIDDQLFGFIISSDANNNQTITTYDMDFFNRFNYLMNLSLEKASRYIERKELKREIDKHIFNLDSISQTMKMILSELSIKGIIQLSTDVIREMTSSSVTSIALYDEVEHCLKIEAYEDVVSGFKHFEQFKLKTEYPKHQSICKMPEDYHLLESIFEDASLFKTFPSEYVILLIKDRIIGFVTIGKPLAFENYDDDLIKRIQDIASIMYIALTNARQFELIAFQKAQLNRQVKVLENMNRIIKTISSADSIEELSELVMTTLNASFGIGKALFIGLNDGVEHVIGCYNMDVSKFDDAFYEVIRNLLDEQPLVYFTIDDYQKAFGDTFIGYLEDVNCFALTPMYLNGVSVEPFGYLLITEARDRLHETQVSMLSILSNSIAPLLNQLLIVNRFNKHYLPNPVYKMNEMLKKYTEEYGVYGLSFRVFIKEVALRPFQVFDIDEYAAYDYVVYNGFLFIFAQSEIETHLFDTVTEENPDIEHLMKQFN